jgi:hypothetical protein
MRKYRERRVSSRGLTGRCAAVTGAKFHSKCRDSTFTGRPDFRIFGVTRYNTRLMRLRIWRIWKASLPFWAACMLVAQTSPSASASGNEFKVVTDLKLFEAATALANTLTSWAFVMIGGSVLAVLGTSYYRPAARWVRCTYLAFIPAWIFLSWSVYAGTRVQGVYLAALYSPQPDIAALRRSVNEDAGSQIQRMEWGLICFGLWLTLYLMWWIFHTEGGKDDTR